MIHVDNISKTFALMPILKNVSFSVEKAKSFVVLGQSGVGKSVLLKILAGLIQPDEGRVHLDSRDIGMLFQKNALFDSLTVFENLEFPLRERTTLSANDRKTEIKKFLEWVGLPNTEQQFPDELSGGMQKRLGIARALIVKPEILFYDEPTAGLDPITSRIIADLILRLKKEFGTTIVVVTSDVLRAYQLGDHIGLLIPNPNGACLLQAGTPNEAKASRVPEIHQFLSGLTHGPLTDTAANPIIAKQNIGTSLTERFDVDFF